MSNPLGIHCGDSCKVHDPCGLCVEQIEAEAEADRIEQRINYETTDTETIAYGLIESLSNDQKDRVLNFLVGYDPEGVTRSIRWLAEVEAAERKRRERERPEWLNPM